MPIIKKNLIICKVEEISMCVYIVKLHPDILLPRGQFGWKQCDLRPYEVGTQTQTKNK